MFHNKRHSFTARNLWEVPLGERQRGAADSDLQTRLQKQKLAGSRVSDVAPLVALLWGVKVLIWGNCGFTFQWEDGTWQECRWCARPDRERESVEVIESSGGATAHSYCTTMSDLSQTCRFGESVDLFYDGDLEWSNGVFIFKHWFSQTWLTWHFKRPCTILFLTLL